MDAYQLKEFGTGHVYVDNGDFEARILKHSRLLLKNFYVPMGPVCHNLEEFDSFLDYMDSQKLTKVKVDVPLVFDEKVSKEIAQKFIKRGYKTGEFLQDEETLVVNKDTLTITKHIRKNVKKGLQVYDVFVKDSLTEEEIQGIYNVYCISAQRIGFEAKPIETVRAIARNTISVIGRHKETNSIDGFILGFRKKMFKDFYGGEVIDVLHFIFSGVTDAAKKAELGYVLNHDIFLKSFEEFGIDYVDFHGASRSKGRTYTSFKQGFGGEFIVYPGSFEKLNIL
jgi:hypothetical protein